MAASTQTRVRRQQQFPRVPKDHRIRWAQTLGWLCLIVASYLLTALVLPIGQDTPLVDEPIYASSAFEYARSGSIEISNLSAPHAVVETIWGGLFTRALGEDIGTLRFATMVFTALSAPFMYVLCRTLGGTRHLSYLGTATYLFTPLAFTLTHVFHTDPYSVGLTVISMALLGVGFHRPTGTMKWLGMGAVAIAVSFLSRPQTLVVVVAAIVAWVWWGDRRKRWQGVAVLSIPISIVFLGHTIWTATVGEPFIRTLSRQDVLSPDLAGVLKVGSQTAVTAGIYLGLFALPMLPLLLPKKRKAFFHERRRLALYLATGLLAAGVGLIASGVGPFDLQAWISDSGFGAVDRSLLGNRPEVPFGILSFITLVLLSSFYLLVLTAVQQSHTERRVLGYRFVVLTGVGLTASVFVSSLALNEHVLDRYWFPMVPIVIAVVAASGTASRPRLAASWCIVVPLAVLALLGLHDAFTVYREAHRFADDVIEPGVDPMHLDGGASWAASYFGLQDEDPQESLAKLGPFWVRFYAVDLDPEYAIALSPIEGYEIVELREYESILQPGSDYLYLVHRDPSLPFYLRSGDF